MKNSIFLILLTIAYSAQAMDDFCFKSDWGKSYTEEDKKREKIWLERCKFDLARSYHANYDTTAWGNRHWDNEWGRWKYDNGVTIQHWVKNIYNDFTFVVFPGFEPIEINGGWEDPRFAKESSAAASSSSSSSSSTASSSSNHATDQYQYNLITELYNHYKKDHIVDDHAWGSTKRYNDDLTAYTFMETGIHVDLKAGVVTFPGYGSLPLSEQRVIIRPEVVATAAERVQPNILHSWISQVRNTVIDCCMAVLWYCVHSRS